jgi:hypothetical protein
MPKVLNSFRDFDTVTIHDQPWQRRSPALHDGPDPAN